MNFTVNTASFDQQNDALAIVFVNSDGTASVSSPDLDVIISAQFELGDFSGKSGQSLTVSCSAALPCARLLLVGISADCGNITEASYLKSLETIALACKSTKAKNAGIYLNNTQLPTRSHDWLVQQIAEKILYKQYRFEQLKSEATKPASLTDVAIHSSVEQKTLAEQGLSRGLALAKGSALCRDLGNFPGNVCTPSYLAQEAERLAQSTAQLSCEILEESDMEALGMGSLLSVSAGSDESAKLIQLQYQGAATNDKPIVLIGKGITFDTGGISLKPGAGMDEMKFDMCGAASVLGAMQTLIELQLPINVVAIIAASENMPNGHATKPGDIVTSMSGKTIEILNTDAEGRLVLCDALTYAEKFEPAAVIDVATLTGACVIALGKHATGLYSNNDTLAAELLEAGKMAGDKAWHMPLWDEYQQQLDSNFADIANIGGREAGSVTAACFLSRFTKAYDWAHLDIAGTAWLSGGQKGATGRPISMLVQYLLNKSQSNG